MRTWSCRRSRGPRTAVQAASCTGSPSAGPRVASRACVSSWQFPPLVAQCLAPTGPARVTPPPTGSSRRLRSQRRLRLAAALLRGERDEGCEPAGFSGNACRLPARAVREVTEVSPEAGLPAPLCAGEVGPLGRSRVGVRPSEFTTSLLALRP